MDRKEQEGREQTSTEAPSVEEAFARLSDIVEQLDSSEITLEESMKLYRQGVELLTQCSDSLDRIEKEMIILTKEGEISNGEVK